MLTHEHFMQRAIGLASAGLGLTYPNPIVGCVIVHKGKIIGEGWHRKAGEAHAEVNAVNSVKDRSLLKEATLYVTLEPCSHFGKTPPCSDLIIAHGIPQVIIGCADPNPQVAGNGIAKLREAGKDVHVGIFEKECRELNKRFFTFQNLERPYIILKWAQSADGFIGPGHKSEARPVWLTNSYSRQLVHKWRTEEHAILVGTQTAIDDNPSLTARDWKGNNPVRVLIDRRHSVPKENHIFDNQAKTLVLTESELAYAQCELVDFSENAIANICAALYRNELQSVIVEGGRHTIQAFIDAGIWDEARVFRSEILLGKGTEAPQLDAACTGKQQLFGDELLIYRNHDQHDYL